MTADDTLGRELTVLGGTVRVPIEHVEVFPAPAHVTEVRLSTEEVASVCPVTSQPDLSTVVITYNPGAWCVETKSLKLYLWGFRQRPVFAEALAAEIAAEVMATASPRRVRVELTQRPRGGIVVSATAELAGEDQPSAGPDGAGSMGR
jgi:7-cyano-7-deazaguanine reductase